MKIAINGFGRIGRATFRNLIHSTTIEVIAINDLTNTQTLAHLLKYDTVHRLLKAEVIHDENHLIVTAVRETNLSNRPFTYSR